MNKNYIGCAKDFLAYKILTFDRKHVSDGFDIAACEHELKVCKTIDEIHATCNKIASQGLKQISQFSNAIKKFYQHLSKNNESFNDVDTNYIEDYINKTCIDLELSLGTRTNYKNALIPFCTYIDKSYSLDKKFNIKKFKVIDTAKKREELTDWMDRDSIVEANKKILTYAFSKKDNGFEKNRDILIFRLFLFSGILPNEMMNLTTESFILKNNYMALKIDGTGAKKREIPLPKAKLIRYYNHYIKLRNIKARTFFYSPIETDKKIHANLLTIIVKRLLEHAQIEVKDKTPKMLRKTFAIFLNNEKNEDGFTQPEKNIQELLGISNITTLRELLKYHTIDVMTASKAFNSLNI